MIGVDLFAGAGGMSLGARLAGVDVRLAVEVDPHAVETYKQNNPTTNVLLSSVEKVKGIPTSKGIGSRVLFGGPPCQGFSTSNQRTRDSSNPSNWLFRHFLRLTAQWRPDWVVFENVKGITETEGGRFLKDIVRELEALGYCASSWLLDAADYGVPQRRRRLFVIGSLHGQAISGIPSATMRPITVKEAIADLPLLKNGASAAELPYRKPALSAYAAEMRGELSSCRNHLVTRSSPLIIARYAKIPQGGNWQQIPRRLMSNYHDPSRCHTGIYHRLVAHKPSIVVGNFRKNMLIHPTQNRGLSVREAARLQSFPDWYEFTGSIGFQQQQVGNAVPPLLAKAVFQAIVSLSHS